MENNNVTVSTDRKVTLSCRVLPEQKLLIAERAKHFDMSLAQYVAAKILRKDNFERERKIEKQKLDIERLKSELKRARKDHDIALNNMISVHKIKSKELEEKLNELTPKNGARLNFPFRDYESMETFQRKLLQLSSKHGIENLSDVLHFCLDYTYENDRSFFLASVQEFVKKFYNSKIY